MSKSPASRGQTEILAGRNAVREAILAGRRRIEGVALASGVREKGVVEEILQLCAAADVPVRKVARSEVDQLAGEVPHQGVVARVSPYPYVELDEMLAAVQRRGERPFLLVLDSLQDPQNVGSLLRTAEAVGVHGVVLPDRRAVGVTPAVSRASAGGVEHLQVALVTNLARTLGELKASRVWVVGIENDPAAQDYRRVDFNIPLALVVGGEGEGLRRLTRETCDLLVHIPMRGAVGSLNVSVAGSIVLYRAWSAREARVKSNDNRREGVWF